MVFIKNLNLKTGFRPSQALSFNYTNLTASQKLKLASCRIFKTFINSSYSKGMNKFRTKKLFNYEDIIRQKYYGINTPLLAFPYLKGFISNDKIEAGSQLERRKMRILMKGIKIGVKKGGRKVNIAGIVSKLN